MDKYLFIAGMEKCGTTALASWLVAEGLAEYLVPGTKEPYIFARTDFAATSPGVGKMGIWRLDASVGYALNPGAIARMPEHFTRIVLCFRNPWERTWSSYKMAKARATKNKDWENRLAQDSNKNDLSVEQILRIHYPDKLHNILKKYQ